MKTQTSSLASSTEGRGNNRSVTPQRVDEGTHFPDSIPNSAAPHLPQLRWVPFLSRKRERTTRHTQEHPEKSRRDAPPNAVITAKAGIPLCRQPTPSAACHPHPASLPLPQRGRGMLSAHPTAVIPANAGIPLCRQPAQSSITIPALRNLQQAIDITTYSSPPPGERNAFRTPPPSFRRKPESRFAGNPPNPQ